MSEEERPIFTTELEERLALLRTVLSIVLAHLEYDGVISLPAVEADVRRLADIAELRKKARTDIDLLFTSAATVAAAINPTSRQAPAPDLS